MSKPFQREFRYLVLKRKDVFEYLTSSEQSILFTLAQCVASGRTQAKKRPLNCVVVEQDWPEYEPVWKMIEDRMNGASPQDELDARRYRARRAAIYEMRLRTEMPQARNWRPTTVEEFNAEYDAACDKEILEQRASKEDSHE